MTLLERLRLQEVKRFGIMHVNREQSVAEHSFNVLLIAREIASVSNDHDLREEVVRHAIEHDMEEVYTGDIPSSFKRLLRTECPGVIRMLDGEEHTSADVKAIVKMADYIEVIYYLYQFGGSKQAMSIIPELSENFARHINTCGVDEPIRDKALEVWHTLVLGRL